MRQDLPQPASRARGFSLVEVAIVLVIIGFILAAVLQGRQLIASAEYKSFQSELAEYRNAFYTFRDRYNALPGDFSEADVRFGLTQGNGDGQIDNGPTCDAADNESCLAWQHLRAAGMLEGNPDDGGEAASPRHPYGSPVEGFFTGNDGNGVFGHKIAVAGVPAEVARRLDEDIDDDDCNSGSIAGLNSTAGADCADPAEGWPGGSAPIDMIYALER